LKKIIQQTLALLSKQERKRLGQLSLFQALISIADIGSLVLLLAMIQLHTQSGTFSIPIIGSLLRIHYLLPIILFLLLFLLKNLMAYLAVKLQYTYVYQVASRLSLSHMRQYLDGSYTDYTQTDSSVTINRIGTLPIQFSHYILAGLQQLFTEVILTTVAIMAILFFQARLFLLLLLVIAPPVALAAFIARKKLRTARSEVKDNAEKTTQYLQEALHSYIESNVLGKKDFFSNRYSRHQKRLNDFLARLQITQALPSRFMEVFAVMGLLLLIVINKYAGPTEAQLIHIGAFMAAAYKIIPGITRIASLSGQIRTYAFALQGMQPASESKATPYNHIRERISSLSFQHISFAYGDKQVLQDFSLELKKGDFLGISSSSGRGKTTLIHLLLGFLQPGSGQICMNNIPLSSEERKLFWPDIIYVKQQQFLIHDTLLRNITLEEDTFDEARLQAAISAAGLEPFVQSFTEGIHKVISDNGKNISGGQRQRIALARALYRDADLLLLDEPFSELDQASEQSMLHYLQDLAARGKIVVLITHNPASLSYCNKTVSVHE
jgi:ABC-type multidrug transport system fused ATPase/permease subunit